jgi:hypothetical protein
MPPREALAALMQGFAGLLGGAVKAEKPGAPVPVPRG